MNFKEIKKQYSLLCGLREAMTQGHCILEKQIFIFNKSIKSLVEITNDENIGAFIIEEYEICSDSFGEEYLSYDEFKMHIYPVLNYLKDNYIEDNRESDFDVVSNTLSTIKDTQIKERCKDILLSDAQAYDRAINQATQILENRIKDKTNLQNTNISGLDLVSKCIHAKLEFTKLKFSNEPAIQEGYSNLFKGLVSIYRNPTHHTLNFQCTREYAIKVCLFIDELLSLIDLSELVTNGE